MTTTTTAPTTPEPTSHDVAPLTGADIPAASRALAAAFEDDPVFAWFVPDPDARRTQLPGWFAVVVDAMLGHRRSCRTVDDAAAALWVPPETEPLTPEQDRLIEVSAALDPEALDRFGALSEAMEGAHPHDPHHYLWFLGVDPDHQGRGLGSGLLSTYLSGLDAHGEAAYLEATSPDNRRLYARHGFEVTGTISAAGSPPMWAMWRDPR